MSESSYLARVKEAVKGMDLSQFRVKNPLYRVSVPSRSVRLDLRYATAHNICGLPLYKRGEHLWLHEHAAAHFGEAVALVREYGGGDYGLVVFDGYRPQRVQEALWGKCSDDRYVADPKKGSMHTRGIAVDVTLEKHYVGTRLKALGDSSPTTDWIPLDMGTDFDEMSEKAHWNAFEKGLITPEQHGNRMELRGIMETAGFETIPTEWWHYQLPVPLHGIDEIYPLIEEHEVTPLTHPDLLAEVA